jgi:Insertion element 4 transposase N-terminal
VVSAWVCEGCCDTPGGFRHVVIGFGGGPGVAHDGVEGVSPEGWLPDRVSVGALTRVFPPELVDRVVATTGVTSLSFACLLIGFLATTPTHLMTTSRVCPSPGRLISGRIWTRSTTEPFLCEGVRGQLRFKNARGAPPAPHQHVFSN